MKELNTFEIESVSGGESGNEGYNFSFIVANALTAAIVGSLFVPGISTFTAAGVGAGYAAAMMGAKLADSYAFPAEASKFETTI